MEQQRRSEATRHIVIAIKNMLGIYIILIFMGNELFCREKIEEEEKEAQEKEKLKKTKNMRNFKEILRKINFFHVLINFLNFEKTKNYWDFIRNREFFKKASFLNV